MVEWSIEGWMMGGALVPIIAVQIHAGLGQRDLIYFITLAWEPLK
jgi:hypothetical protein